MEIVKEGFVLGSFYKSEFLGFKQQEACFPWSKDPFGALIFNSQAEADKARLTHGVSGMLQVRVVPIRITGLFDL